MENVVNPIELGTEEKGCKCKQFDINKQIGEESVRFYSSENTSNLYESLLNFHKNFSSVKKNMENSFHENKYADINAILDTIRPLLTEQSLILMQFPVNGIKEGSICIKTRLVHTSTGQFIENDSVSLVPPKPDAQNVGSVETYLRRYSLNAILGLSFSNDDDGVDAMITEEVEEKTVVKPKSSRRTL